MSNSPYYVICLNWTEITPLCFNYKLLDLGGIFTMAFNWPETIATDETPRKLIAQNLPMNEIYSLKFDAFFRGTGDETGRALFLGSDGGPSTNNRCGGRLPSMFVFPGSDDDNFRIDFNVQTLQNSLKCLNLLARYKYLVLDYK